MAPAVSEFQEQPVPNAQLIFKALSQQQAEPWLHRSSIGKSSHQHRRLVPLPCVDRNV